MANEQIDEKAIFNVARQIDSPGARRQYLAQVCGADSSLLERVETLLHGYEEQASFLESSPIAKLTPTVGERITEKPGTQIGPYRLLQQLGEGGMGVVYMAEQKEPVKRRVALKIIKPGMDTRRVIARFEAERQALAMMDHPNIATVLDVGTTSSGRPFFIMELVKGTPITQYCDEHHLTPRERLELFIPVCHAVQHAHQKGVIHRDIKPSNVLVADYDDTPVPKIIDFGLAKAVGFQLTQKTCFTEYGQIVGTIHYMSPEQAKLNQLDIDTRTDIYSLGVVLYELLSGETPFARQRLQSAAFDEMLRIIREEEPPRPSIRVSTSDSLPTIAANRHVEPRRLSTLVRGELDWIVMKAIDKERSRRYETANGVAMDIQHYLNNEPVLARSPSTSYTLKKFVRRNKGIVSTFAAVAVCLVLGILGTSYQAFHRGIQRDRAILAEAVSSQALIEKNKALKNAQQSEKEAKWNLYAAQLFPMKAAWERSDYGELEHLLEDSRPTTSDPDFRDWEWYFFQDRCRQANRLFKREQPICCGDVCLETGRIALAFATEIEILSAGTLETDFVIRVAAITRHRQEGDREGIIDVKWSNDGRFLACAYGGWGTRHLITIWDTNTGDLIQQFDSGGTRWCQLAWSPDGAMLAVSGEYGSRTCIRVWNTGNWSLVQSLKLAQGTTKGVRDIQWHPDGRRLATSHNGFPDLCVWDVTASTPIATKNLGSPGIAWSPDGSAFATAREQRLIILDEDWKEIASAPCDEAYRHSEVGDLQWSPDGKMVAFGGHAQTVVMLNRESGESTTHSIHGRQIARLSWGPNSQQLLVIGGERARLFTVAKLNANVLTRRIGEGVKDRNSVAWSPDASMVIATHRQGIVFVDSRTGKVHGDFPVGPSANAIWHPGGQIATSLSVSALHVWDVSDINSITLKRKIRLPTTSQIRFSPNGSQLAVTSRERENSLTIWDSKTWERLDELPDPGTMAVAWGPGGKMLAVGANEGFRVWDIDRKTVLRKVVPQMRVKDSLDWSKNGRIILAASLGGEIGLFHSQDLATIAILHGHRGPARSVSHSPNQRRIASCGTDGNIVIWDSATATKLLSLPCDSSVEHVTWSPDGRRLASLCGDGTLRIWGSADVETATENATHLETGRLASLTME